MQELLGGVLGDFLSEGSSRSRNVICSPKITSVPAGDGGAKLVGH